ncbi:MAG: WG repeat-containing protein, partial [Oscillospiraceae bacterium]|nr:WG repeat-containing protein [Oscillospiraceae bacterium]
MKKQTIHLLVALACIASLCLGGAMLDSWASLVKTVLAPAMEYLGVSSAYDPNGGTSVHVQVYYSHDIEYPLVTVETEDGKRGVCDGLTGDAVIEPGEYDEFYFTNGWFKVKKNDQYGFADVTGKFVVPCTYDDVEVFINGLAQVKKNGKYGFVNTTGQLVVPCEYDRVSDFSDGLASVQKDGKQGYVDKSGQLVIPCEYDNAGIFSNGLASVQKDGKRGYVDKSGQLVIPCEYDDADIFSNGLASVQKDGKWGYVDKTGKLVVPCEYDEAFAFNKGAAVVGKIVPQLSEPPVAPAEQEPVRLLLSAQLYDMDDNRPAAGYDKVFEFWVYDAELTVIEKVTVKADGNDVIVDDLLQPGQTYYVAEAGEESGLFESFCYQLH